VELKIKVSVVSVILIINLVLQISPIIASGFQGTKPPINSTIDKYVFTTEWGTKGKGDGQFLRPHDLEFDNKNKYLYAVDRDGNRIQVFDKNGTFLFAFGEKGQGDGQFLVPYGIDVDSSGNVWVADRGNHRIQKFDSIGKFILKFGNNGTGPSSEPGKFDNPRHVQVDRELKFVYVADSKNNRIQQFDLNGTFVKVIGKLGKKPGEFNLPTTIEQDSKGQFFVTERGNERIQKFDSKWRPILSWGSLGSSNDQFCHMEHLVVDNHDNVFVTDPQSDPGCSMKPRVLKFDNNGIFITKFGSAGKGTGQILDPEHLAVDNNGNVYVSDRKNEKILVYSPLPE